MDAQIANVYAIDSDRSAIDVIKARQEIGKGGFSTAALPHECHGLSGTDTDIHIAHNGCVFIISECDIVILHVTLQLRNRLRFLRISDRIDRAQDLIDTFHRGKTFLDSVHCFRQLFGRIDDAIEDHQIVDELRCGYRRRAGNDQRSPEPEYDRYGYRAEKLTHRMGKRLSARHAVGEIEE